MMTWLTDTITHGNIRALLVYVHVTALLMGAIASPDVAKDDYDNHNDYQSDQSSCERQRDPDCPPCNSCAKEEQSLQCKGGVSVVRDGCCCCHMCARQQGDLCNKKDRCDEEKGLYCNMTIDGGVRGICRARNPKSCDIEGKTYRDGERMENCSQLCTCQDGRYSCTSLCPHEARPPASAHCKDPHLVHIADRKAGCCREWVCPHEHSLGTDGDHSSNFPNEPPAGDRCRKDKTKWSECSETCGMGVMIRMNHQNCQPVQERRLCMIRPCQPDTHQIGRECRSTIEDRQARPIQNGECTSVAEYRLKYCSTCKANKRCLPATERTKQIKFKCPQNKIISEPMMMIRSCVCTKLKDAYTEA